MTWRWSHPSTELTSDPEQRQGSQPLSPPYQGKDSLATKHSTDRPSCWGWQEPCALGDKWHWQRGTSREDSQQKPALNTLNHTLSNTSFSLNMPQRSYNDPKYQEFCPYPRRPALCALSVRVSTSEVQPPFWPPPWPWFKHQQDEISLRSFLTPLLLIRFEIQKLWYWVFLLIFSSPSWATEVTRLKKNNVPPNATFSFLNREGKGGWTWR